MKVRVHQLAKELGVSAQDVIDKANQWGIALKSNLSAIDEQVAVSLRQAFVRRAATAAAAGVPPAPIKPAPKVAPVHVKPKAKPPVAPPALARPPVGPPAARPVSAFQSRASAPVKPSVPQAPQKPRELPRPAPRLPLVPKAAEIVKPAEPRTAQKAPLPEHREVRVLRPYEVDFLARDSSQDSRIKRRTRTPGTLSSGGFFRGKKFQQPSHGQPAHSGPLSLQRPLPKPPEKVDKVIEVELPITLKDFSQQLGIRAALLIRKLMDMGVTATINDSLAEDAAMLLGLEFGKQIKTKKTVELEDHLKKIIDSINAKDSPEKRRQRPPVVTIMGHVDHGKTSLLDRIRQANVAASESGGITQHISAWRVTVGGKTVVFLDTPGHKAFTAMRGRGANVTDIVVLVVAADDGVMPQTEEAINHARAANVPIVVALNKMDKPGANPHKVKQQLATLNLIPEEWGGTTIFAEVSAVTGLGIEHLIEVLALQSEMLELKANPELPAHGAVLEAQMQEGVGVCATILVQNGTLYRGDIILCGKTHGRVRTMLDEKGVALEAAEPSTPLSLIGLSAMPEAGDKFYVVDSVQLARELAEEREGKARRASLMERLHITLDNLFTSIEEGKLKEVRVVIKADVKGSVEVLTNSLNELSTSEVKIRVIHNSVGDVNESDVVLADASDAIVLGFHVEIEDRARALAQEKGVEIRQYDVIYQIVEDMKAALSGMLEPERIEVVKGHLTVREVFKITRLGNVAGCVVANGKIQRNSMARLIRGGKVLHEGKLGSLKRFKDDVKEVAEGFECGLKFASFNDVQAGDVIEVFEIQEIPRKL